MTTDVRTMEISIDPAVSKVIEYAKEKKTISFDELSDFLPVYITNSDKIDQVLVMLQENNVQLVIEEDSPADDEGEPDGRKNGETEKKRLVYSEKESSVDDPIRLYLREIGQENLLTAEEEIKYSKQMEDGENIIKNVIKKSGMIIPEFYHIAQRAFSKKDPRELNFSNKKEITEYITERRRLNQFYRDTLRLIGADLKNYIEMKRRIITRGGDIFDDDELGELRRRILM